MASRDPSSVAPIVPAQRPTLGLPGSYLARAPGCTSQPAFESRAKTPNCRTRQAQSRAAPALLIPPETLTALIEPGLAG
jgi:hypothetical protein